VKIVRRGHERAERRGAGQRSRCAARASFVGEISRVRSARKGQRLRLDGPPVRKRASELNPVAPQFPEVPRSAQYEG
jgi:hypothetical protein